MTGRWFPGFRVGTKEQAREYREAKKALERNGRTERAQGIRDETDRYHELNRAVAERERPLGGPQLAWNFHRSLVELDREDTTQRRAARSTREGRSR